MINNSELEQFESKWRQIDENFFSKILDYSKKLSSFKEYKIDKPNYIHLYDVIYSMLMSKNIEIRNMCEKRLLSTLKFHCESILEQLMANVSFENFMDKWEIFDRVVLYWVLKTFNYLTRIKSLIERKNCLEKDLKNIFRVEVYNKVAPIIKQNFIEHITEFRNKTRNILDIPRLKAFVSFLEYFEIENEFLQEFIEKSEAYYREKCASQNKDSYLNYLAFGIDIIQLETVNLALIVPTMTMTKLISDLNEIIFFTNYQQLLDTPDGFSQLLENNEITYLQKSFAIFSRSEQTLNVLISYFKKFINKKYREIVSKFNLDATLQYLSPKEVIKTTGFIGDYTAFQNRIIYMIQASFSNNNHFLLAFKEVLEDLQSKKENINLSYLLPFYFDKILTKQPENQEIQANQIVDELVLQEIDKKISIIPYIPDKDIFISIHQNLLANRLLFESLVSIACENYLLDKLKTLCGEEFILKADTMIQDYEKNKEINAKYKEHIANKPINHQIETSFLVLTGEHWPNLNTHKMTLPDILSGLSKEMFSYYEENYKGRTLKLSLSNSNMIISAKLNGKKYDISCNTYQGVILTLFNSFGFKQGLSKQIINSKLNFEDIEDLDSSLAKLVKAGIMMKNIDGLYYLNSNFNSEDVLIKIEGGKVGESFVKKEKIEGDRTLAIDGHTVKVLKEKKSLKEDDLINLVIERLDKFKITKETVKKRIDSLVSKELIWRNKNDPTLYEYFNATSPEKKENE